MEDDFRLMLAVALYHNCGVEVYQRDPNCSAKLPHSALRTLHELECAVRAGPSAGPLKGSREQVAKHGSELPEHIVTMRPTPV